MQTIRLNIGGMHCGACVRRVRAALEGVPGVSVRDVTVGHAEVEVPEGESDEAVQAAVLRAGFTPALA